MITYSSLKIKIWSELHLVKQVDEKLEVKSLSYLDFGSQLLASLAWIKKHSIPQSIFTVINRQNFGRIKRNFLMDLSNGNLDWKEICNSDCRMHVVGIGRLRPAEILNKFYHKQPNSWPNALAYLFFVNSPKIKEYYQNTCHQVYSKVSSIQTLRLFLYLLLFLQPRKADRVGCSSR